VSPQQDRRPTLPRERARAEARGRRLLRRIIEHMADGIVVVDRGGDVRFANRAAERLLARPRAALVGLAFGFPVVDEMAELDLPGERVAEMRVVGIAWEGQRAWLASLRDVTERRQAEEAARRLWGERAAREAAEREQARLREVSEQLARAVERLREEDRRKDQLMAMLGHELRNPLAAIDSGLGVLEEGGTADAARLHQMLAMMRRQVRRQAALLDGLLDVSSIARGTLRLERRRLPLAEVVAAAAASCRDRLEGHQLVVRGPAGPLVVDVDGRRLEQVVCHLLDNAVKYSPPGGRIELVVRREDATAVIEVSDHGAGIAPEMQETIFEPFLQVPQEYSSPAAGGLGIGLALVKRLVELHGGAVAVSSRGLGQGSTFAVRLPAEPPGGHTSCTPAAAVT
jgi:signal transduction histidine kinase